MKTTVDTLSGIGEALDHLVLADLTSRGAVTAMYQAARGPGDEPLSMAAARHLKAACAPGSRVLILTGWPSRSWLFGDLTETDGPVGAAVLARAFEEGLGVVPVIGCLDPLVGHMQTCLRGAGLIVGSLAQALSSKPGPPTASVGAAVSLPGNADSARLLFDAIRPSAVVAIEVPGPGVDGVCHTVTGRPIPPDRTPRADLMFDMARAGGVLTVGIGDGGNELGMGRLRAALVDVIPYGDRALCATPADREVVASISNWGGQALAAAVLAVTGRTDIFDRLDVERIIRLSSDAGAIDGLTSRVDAMVDGTPAAMSQALWQMMALAVRSGLGGWLKG